jgi:hypothetical protein
MPDPVASAFRTLTEADAPSRVATRAIFAAVCGGSLAGVYLQVSLMKLTAVMFYPIFYAMIGVALLGYGAAGSVLAVRAAPASGHPGAALGRWLLAFAGLAVPAFLGVNAIDLPAQTLFGSLHGLPALLLIYALLTLPFLLLGLGIASAFTAYAADANRLYFADLLGAAAGSVVAVATLPWLGGAPLVGAAGVVGAASAAAALRAAGRSARPALIVGALDLAFLIAALITGAPAVRVAPDKHGPILAKSAKPGGAAIEFSGWSRFGRVDVTEPFATLPPQFGGDVSPLLMRPIEQRMLTLDGAAPAFLYRVERSPAELDFLAATSQSPAYRLRPSPQVLVIGVGGATDVLIALSQGARRVVGVEVNPVTVHATRDVFGPYVGNVLTDPRVTVVVAEGRNFAARDHERYDIVQLSGVDTGAAQGAYGLATMPESYVYTVEALHDLLARLAPDGVLSITRDMGYGWALRLVNVARAALAGEGLDAPPRIAVLKGTGYGWATVLVKREPFTQAETTTLRDFADRYRFPLLYDPIAGSGDAEFVRVVREGTTTHADLDLRPPTDDWPFFFLSFRWRSLPRLLASETRPLLNPVGFLIANLAGLTILALVLIGWPLWRLRAAWRETPGKAIVAGYFAALGAGFIFVEVALMQRFTIFLGDPALAVATVLAALLVSSGLGSWAARRAHAHPATLWVAVIWILIALAFFASPLSRALLRDMLPAPLATRLALAALLVAVVGFPMGMPFPTGLARMAQRSGPFVPWAWGINGMLSVVSSLASYLVGMAAGYTAMFYAGAVLYAAALALSRRL